MAQAEAAEGSDVSTVKTPVRRSRGAKAKKAATVSLKLSILSLLLLLGTVLLLWKFRAPLLKNWVFPRLTSTLGIPVRGDIFSLSRDRGITLTNVQVGTDDAPIFKAGQIELIFDPVESGRAAWNRRLVLSEVVLDDAELTLRKDKAGKWIGFPKPESTPAQAPAQAPAESTPPLPVPTPVTTSSADTSAPEVVVAPDPQGSFLLRRFAVNRSIILYEDAGSETSVQISKFTAVLANFGQSKEAQINASLGLKATLRGERSVSGDFAVSKITSTLGQSFEPQNFGFALVATSLSVVTPEYTHAQDRLSIAGDFNEKNNAWRLTAASLVGKNPTFAIRGDGDLGLVKGFPGALTLVASVEDVILAPIVLKNVFEASGKTNAKVSLNYSPKESTFSGQMSAAQLQGVIANVQITQPADVVVSIEGSFSPQQISVNALSASIGADGRSQLAIKGNSTVRISGETARKSNVSVEADLIDADALQKLIVKRGEQPAAQPVEATPEVSPSGAAAQPVHPAATKPSMYGSALDYTLVLHELRVASRTFREIDLHGALTPEEVQLQRGTMLIGKSTLAGEGVYRMFGAKQFSVKLASADLDIEAVHELAAPASTEPDAKAPSRILGSFKSFAFHASGSALDSETLQKSLSADLRSEMSEVTLPARLTEVVPFNVLVLPAKAVSSVTSLFPAGLAPAEVAAQGAAVSESLKHSDSFRIVGGRLRLKVRDQQVRINQLRVGTILLPDVYFSGHVGFDQSLAIDSGVKLLGVELPLPITGTLSSPRPDMTAFAEGLVTHFAKSIVTAPVNAIRSGFTSGVPPVPQKSVETQTGPQQTEEPQKTDEEERPEENGPPDEAS